MEPESIKCVFTTISLSQRQEKQYKSLSHSLVHNKDFVCKITEELSQPCSYIIFHALTNTKILDYKTNSYLTITRSKSLIFNLLLQGLEEKFYV